MYSNGGTSTMREIWSNLVFDDSSRRCDWPEIACKSRSDCPYTDFQQVAEKEGYADCELWAASGDCYDPAKHTEWACGDCVWQKWVAKNCPECANNDAFL